MHLVFRFIIFIFVSLLSSSHGISQETPPTLERGEASPVPVIESIVVTGSLVPKGDFVSKAPIATISSDQFEMTNAVNVESLINSMPQVVGGADRSSTWGAGIATANLRGLGENRTLVLVNSRRFVPTFPDGGTVDLNFIPVGLIDRVEVLTGGASAAYGSDALAGVINFILKEDFDGWEFNGGMEQSEMGDAEIMNFNVTNGGTFAGGNGSYMLHLDVLDRKAVGFSERSISTSELLDRRGPNGGVEGLYQNPASLPTTPNAAFFSIDLSAPDPFQTFNLYSFQNDGNMVANFNFADFGTEQFSREGAFDNVNSFQFLQLPQKRESFKGKLNYDFAGTEFYADFYYSKSEVPTSWPGPVMGYPTQRRYHTTVEDNPFWSDETKQNVSFFHFGDPRNEWIDANGNGLADQVKIVFLTRIFSNDIGTSYNDRTFESSQFEFGFRGDFTQSWSYEIFAQIGEVESVLDPEPLINPSRLQEGLLIDESGNCDAAAALALAIEPSGDCVPVNIWSDDIGQAAANFIRYPANAGRSVSVNEQNVVMGTISGNTADWFTLPGDPGPIGAVIGFEFIEIKSKIDTPTFVEEQQFEGFSFSPFSLDAGIDTTSIFGELLVPLISGRPGIEFLEIELGWRSSDHSNTGRASTYKGALSYYPTEDFQFRSSFNKAMRSPSINELYRYNQTTSAGFWDPCTIGDAFNQDRPGYARVGAYVPGVTDNTDLYVEMTPELAALCVATGVPEENLYNTDVNEFTNVPQNFGGDPNLKAEDATTISIGFVWTPFDYDLSLSVDYFNVEIENYIETAPVTPFQLLQYCYITATAPQKDPNGIQDVDNFDTNRGGAGSSACNSISRNSDGGLESVFLGFQNLGLHELKGWDFNISYGTDLFGGYFDINYFATKISHRTIQDDSYGDVNFDCVGEFNGDCDKIIDYPVPDFKHRMTTGWSRDNLELQLVWKHISALDDGNDFVEYYTEQLDAYSLFDASGRYTFDDTWMFTIGVKNLFDKQPQRLGSNSPEGEDSLKFGSTNTLPQFYDVFGRTFFLKLTSYF